MLSLVGYVTRDLWIPDWYREHQRRSHEFERDSQIYNTLEKGPIFSPVLKSPLQREALVDEVRRTIIPCGQYYIMNRIKLRGANI